MQVLWNSKVKFISVSQLWLLALCFLFGSAPGPFTAPGLIVSLGGWGGSLLHTLNLPSEFCWSSWMPQAEEGWAFLFSLFFGFVRMGQVWATLVTVAQPLASYSVHCWPPLSICTRLAPLIHQLCCQWGALIRDNSHTTFSLFAGLGAGHPQSLFRVVQLPHWVKSFWGLLNPWALMPSSELSLQGASSFLF